MDIPNWALAALGLFLLILVAGWALFVFEAVTAPPPRNRPAPPGLIEQDEQARIAALRRVAERQRQQQQREASARISRGF